MKTQFTDFWYSGKTPRSSRCSEKKQVQLPESPKKPKTRSFGEKVGNHLQVPYPVCPKPITETQKTNSIPFAKPIRRPKLILMN